MRFQGSSCSAMRPGTKTSSTAMSSLLLLIQQRTLSICALNRYRRNRTPQSHLTQNWTNTTTKRRRCFHFPRMHCGPRCRRPRHRHHRRYSRRQAVAVLRAFGNTSLPFCFTIEVMINFVTMSLPLAATVFLVLSQSLDWSVRGSSSRSGIIVVVPLLFVVFLELFLFCFFAWRSENEESLSSSPGLVNRIISSAAFSKKSFAS